jgi:hypothetical protein
VTSDSVITLAQFVVEYDSTKLHLDSLKLGPDATSFTLLSNTSLSFAGSFTNAKNVLAQISSNDPAGGFVGEEKQVVLLYFQGIGASTDSSPLLFDSDSTHTFLTSPNLADFKGQDITLENGQIALPVELVSLSANAVDDKVHLNWLVVSESNNFGFDVERSTDNINYEKIGFVEGQGNINTSVSYTYIDSNVKPGTYYYRLKQVDRDGGFIYSESIEVIVFAPRRFALYQNYPNPFNSSTQIRYQLSKACHVKLQVLNVLGREICRLVDKNQEAGHFTINWNGIDDYGRDIASGTYIFRLIAGEFVDMKKMAIIK